MAKLQVGLWEEMSREFYDFLKNLPRESGIFLEEMMCIEKVTFVEDASHSKCFVEEDSKVDKETRVINRMFALAKQRMHGMHEQAGLQEFKSRML
jgi:hypothetical protein